MHDLTKSPWFALAVIVTAFMAGYITADDTRIEHENAAATQKVATK